MTSFLDLTRTQLRIHTTWLIRLRQPRPLSISYSGLYEARHIAIGAGGASMAHCNPSRGAAECGAPDSTNGSVGGRPSAEAREMGTETRDKVSIIDTYV